MKLLRLKLNSPFRSLSPGFEINFLPEWNYEKIYQFNPHCLVGKNGSGKSNVLEALAAIFYHIECIYLNYRPQNFADEDTGTGFDPSSSSPDSFELEYCLSASMKDLGELSIEEMEQKNIAEFDHVEIEIIKQANERPKLRCTNLLYLNEKDGFLNRQRIKKLLPKYILGYSSGSNEILSLPFYKMRFIHYDEFYDRLLDKSGYSGKPEGRLIYLDEQYSQAILLCHFIFPESNITQTFADELGIEGIKSFRIGIRQPFEKLYDGVDDDRHEVYLTSLISDSIDKLSKCSTTQTIDEHTQETLFDFWINDATREAFQLHFGSALELFQFLQILFTLNLHSVQVHEKKELYQSQSLYANEGISSYPSDATVMRFKHFWINKKGTNQPILLKALSDGEHQFMHTIGLCLLYRNEPALFLLDEPETHLNPSWRASYISILRRALQEDSKDVTPTTREVLLTSHSPFIVSDCQQENVLVFKKSENNEVTCERPEFKTFGTSANIITSKIFEQGDTIGEFARSQLDNLELRLQKGEDADDLIDEAHNLLGDSVEKILFVNRVLEKKGKS